MRLKTKSWIRRLTILPLGLSFASYAVSTITQPNSVTQMPSPSSTAAVKPPKSTNTLPASKTIDWIDLLPMNVNREVLMEHYADLIIQRLDPADDPNLQANLMAEFAQAPTNPDLAGNTIRLAGYMVVLASREDRITEFLLVPYSGAGLHQPAPPANQMILVRAQPEQALLTSQEYESVWVEGKLQIQSNTTASAQVNYLIDPAQVRLYTAEDAKQAETQAVETTHNEPDHAHEQSKDGDETPHPE
ncbi:hypothetical protein SAMN02745130_02843 [Thiothrix eikelboomii]|uniref:DUF3299 domain-containing protein n=1 Tax=Thiothrix eikelboomii TaxID=92487 RepID=A0A1T4XEI6_9GAMM|nr:DUF3299 domain-containing protein [Thiothrix eikelboomii]SKA87608.1 hypothetical protein SAMN02745130_02843 [Thiothrix eikelboomii]